ncbi:MAG TPA: DMT family transporter [Halobacteriales archaeon]|nr:DMT family transporter [Halobacteriales archaeon]
MAALTKLADRTPPGAALAVAVLAVSTSAILVRWSAAPSLVKAFYRVAFTALLLSPWVLTRHRDAFRRLGRRDLLVAAATGVALAVHFASWFESLRFTSVAASVTLVQSQPLFVALGAWLALDERVTRRTVAGILIAIAGMAAMTLPGATVGTVEGAGALYGNALAVVGAITAAAYVLAGRSLRQRIDLLPYVTVVYVACAATLLVVALARGHAVSLSAYPPREWLLFLAMALGPGVLGHTVVNWALEHVESSVVSVSLLGEPVGSTLLAALLLAEVPGPATVAGGAVVLAGIYVTARSRRTGR